METGNISQYTITPRFLVRYVTLDINPGNVKDFTVDEDGRINLGEQLAGKGVTISLIEVHEEGELIGNQPVKAWD